MYPKVNEMLYLQLASAETQEPKEEFKSRVAEMKEDSLLIEIPFSQENGRQKRLHLGEELSIYYISADGKKSYFNSYVLGFLEDQIQLVRIRKPEPEGITAFQRRGFLRVNASLEIAVKFHHDFTRFLARTRDVSGGGLSFYGDSRHPLTEGQPLSCWLLINYRNGTVEHMPFEGEVVRIQDQEAGPAIVMLKFTDIKDAERQKVIKYCFERQLETRNA
ncbi:PilZ domain-containing protein [Paenibacillus sp. JX-17]|uniref:PilZ domain-containing protein n=1 Tax=Paenibacillus lacisoli TaxID=3064525 RepID=A0ABT9C8U5_9BACL|nr:PilZ domain-containing protein [Paenibacillus sp. JX-17]MDO7905094.1 PilZ domain-containing protein [Paenibacillus sp. JX-17]